MISVRFTLFDKNINENVSKFFRENSNDGTLHIIAKKYGKCFSINADLFRTDYYMSEQGCILVKKLWEDELDFLESSRILSKNVDVCNTNGPTILSMSHILPERIDFVCKKLVYIIQNYNSITNKGVIHQ